MTKESYVDNQLIRLFPVSWHVNPAELLSCRLRYIKAKEPCEYFLLVNPNTHDSDSIPLLTSANVPPNCQNCECGTPRDVHIISQQQCTKLLGVLLGLRFMKAWYLGRIVLEFCVRFQFFFRGVVIRGRISAESTETLIARHGAKTVVPFAC